MRICGDVNRDGIVDIGDIVLLWSHVGDPAGYPLADEWAGDVNGDGIIDMGDVALLQSHVVGNPEEYPLHCREDEDGTSEPSKIPIEVIIGVGLAVIAGIVYFIRK